MPLPPLTPPLRRPAAGSKLLRLSVAGLQIALDARGSSIPLAVPPAYEQFLLAGPVSQDAVVDGAPEWRFQPDSGQSGSRDKPAKASIPGLLMASGQDGLTLTVRDGALRETAAWRPLYTPPDTWQLWQDEAGRYVFAVGQTFSPPGRQITVDAGFHAGEVLGPFSAQPDPAVPFYTAQGCYPLQGIDTMLYVNWLAESGDLVLHASGVVADGRGYAFAGASGAGKSTLAAAFMETSKITLLGEDSLVLRTLDDGFRIFGTPWHIDAARCAAADAPLAKLFFLDRSVPAGVEPLSPTDGVARLLQTAFIPYYRPEAVARILDTLARLAERVPFYTLSYRLGDDPLEIVRDA